MDDQPLVRPDAGYVHIHSESPKVTGTTSGDSPWGNARSLIIELRFTIADFMYNGILEY